MRNVRARIVYWEKGEVSQDTLRARTNLHCQPIQCSARVWGKSQKLSQPRCTKSSAQPASLCVAGEYPLLLVGFILVLFLDVLQQSDLADLVTIVVDDISIVVDLETGTVTKITSCKATDNVTVLVTNLTLFVDTHASHGVDTTLLLFWLPSLSLSNDVAVLVVDITILIDLVAGKLLDIAFDDTRLDEASWTLLDIKKEERAGRSGGLKAQL
jgi:hypothetical protein